MCELTRTYVCIAHEPAQDGCRRAPWCGAETQLLTLPHSSMSLDSLSSLTVLWVSVMINRNKPLKNVAHYSKHLISKYPSCLLVNRQDSFMSFSRPSFTTSPAKHWFHRLELIFKPYIDFLSRHTLFFPKLRSHPSPSGMTKYISSSKSLFRNAVLTSIWQISKSR